MKYDRNREKKKRRIGIYNTIENLTKKKINFCG